MAKRKAFIEYHQEIKVATDAVCITKDNNDIKVLLIKRQYEPFKEHWALPGGFLRNDEEMEQGVERELREETNIAEHTVKDIEFIGVYGKVGRDPRQRIISMAYLFLFDKTPGVSKANESLEVEWIALDRIQSGEVKLAFDHEKILEDALKQI